MIQRRSLLALPRSRPIPADPGRVDWLVISLAAWMGGAKAAASSKQLGARVLGRHGMEPGLPARFCRVCWLNWALVL